jgi:hypothetical protein
MVKMIFGLVIVAVLAATAWFLYHAYRSVRTETFVSQNQTIPAAPKQENDNGMTACPQDARQCPDGSYVSRTGADCEFAACPIKTGEPTIPEKPTLVTKASDLLSVTPYVNEKHQYTFAPPKGWTTDGKSNYFIDATYIDTKADTEGKLTFKTNVNIGAVPMNVAGISSLDNCVTADKLAKMFPKYTSTGDTRETVNGTAVRIIGGTYDYGDYHLRNEQLLAVKNGFYYDVTVTALASKWDAHKEVIDTTLRSLVIR